MPPLSVYKTDLLENTVLVSQASFYDSIFYFSEFLSGFSAVVHLQSVVLGLFVFYCLLKFCNKFKFSLLFMILLNGLTDFLICYQIKMVTQPPSAAEEARILYIQLFQPAQQMPQKRNTWEGVCLLRKPFLTALLWLFLSFLFLLSYQSNCFSLKKQNCLNIKISHCYC